MKYLMSIVSDGTWSSASFMHMCKNASLHFLWIEEIRASQDYFVDIIQLHIVITSHGNKYFYFRMPFNEWLIEIREKQAFVWVLEIENAFLKHFSQERNLKMLKL